MHRVEERDLIEQPTLVIRARLEVPDIREWIGRAFARVKAAIDASGARPVGPAFARFEPADDRLDTFDIEAGFPVAAPLAVGPGDVRPSCLPGGPAVVTPHVGPYEEMTPAYDALEKWVADRGCTVAGSPWENYCSEPQGDPATWTTEIVLPYHLAESHAGAGS